MHASQDLLSGVNLTTLISVDEVSHGLDLGVCFISRQGDVSGHGNTL